MFQIIDSFAANVVIFETADFDLAVRFRDSANNAPGAIRSNGFPRYLVGKA